MQRLLSVFLLVIFISSSVSSAYAEKSEWFLGAERRAIFKLLKGKLLLEIECRDNERPGLHLGKDEFRVTYTDNPLDKKILWAVGGAFGRYKKKAEKQNYKLVSLNQYVRKSGLKIRCAVWHEQE